MKEKANSTALTSSVYLAADFGGGSGRIMVGFIDKSGHFCLEEVHRFPNKPIQSNGHLCWNFPELFRELKKGLQIAAGRYGTAIRSLGIDTWGVDFGIIDSQGELLGLPVCYRDGRTEGMQDLVFNNLDRRRHYATTGIQQMDINTLFQLYSMKAAGDKRLHEGARLLFMPDLFSYYLTGVPSNEYTIASTSELLDARRRTWSWETLDALELPRHLFSEPVMPGHVRGRITDALAAETGLEAIDIVAVGSHDTASAVCATPLVPGAAFLSSGTWSLLGVELSEPILADEARRAEFTNEGGVSNTIRFLQNITGLWLLQRLMGEWESAGAPQTFAELLPAAEASRYDALIPVDDPRFVNPASMESEIKACLREQNATLPESKADLTRLVLRSLAHKYAEAIRGLNSLLPSPVTQLNIIGGGSQNALLNQFTADATGLPVLAGPVEATAMGNILVQAIAAGELPDLVAARNVVQQSVALKRFEPQ